MTEIHLVDVKVVCLAVRLVVNLADVLAGVLADERVV